MDQVFSVFFFWHAPVLGVRTSRGQKRYVVKKLRPRRPTPGSELVFVHVSKFQHAASCAKEYMKKWRQ